jgi:hypothetical protein
MPKKIQDCTKEHLVSVELPVHGDSYTVISHESVMDMSIAELTNAGFTVIDEEYRATADGNIAQGVYKLNYNSDPELSMMFAWTNSYNKQVKFKCGVGAYINKTGTVMVCGDMGSWARKHMGTADEETAKTIIDQIQNAQMYYDQLSSDKESMKDITMNKRKQAQMLGILFAEYQILTTEQASMIRNQMDKPSHVFEDSNSLWAFYNYITLALQHSHPRNWMEDQRILHYFISSINNFGQVQVPAPVVNVVPAVFVDPNQTDILSQLADIEAEEMMEDFKYAEAEVDDLPFPIHIESDSEYAERVAQIEGEPEPLVNDEIVIYTDKDGNTFEVPVVIESFLDQVDESFEEKIKEEEANLDLLEPVKIVKEELEDADFDLDFTSLSNDDDEDEASAFDF